VLKPATPSTLVDEVAINYLPKNVAPVVDEIVVQPGARIQPPPKSPQDNNVAVNLGPPQPAPPRVDPAVTATKDRSFVAVRWSAHDDNDDTLAYSVYYRGDNQTEWTLLKSGIADKFYSFDSGLLPDGGYTVRVVASDAPSHTPEEALAGERESPRFEVDNTAPRIENLAARRDGQQIHVTFHATDDFSPIRRAEYSVDAGDWQYVEPVGQLSDAKSLNYDFTIPLSAATEEPPDQKRGRGKTSAPRNEHVVVVRVFDRYDNVATAKSVVR
jgi:hypothetical protein